MPKHLTNTLKATSAIVYDPATGNVTSITEDGVTTTFTYNPDGTVNTETMLGKVRTWAYDANGNPTSSTVV
jgi:YD repeat-containing protein